MKGVSKFLWFPWLKSNHLGTIQSDAGLLDYWQGKHFGYNRLKSGAMHQRGILRIANLGWLVLDSLKSTIDRNYCLHWLFPDICENWDGKGSLVLKTLSGKYFVQ